MELKRYTDARNAFGRAVEHDPALAAAHYNLSFTLGQLGDFEGALRETKRALELESYYVPQKFALTIDLQYEDPTIAIAPDVATEVGLESLGGEFAFDPGTLDDLFEELAPARGPGRRRRELEDPLTLARDYLSKGLLELATAEVTRAQGRGAGRAEAQTLLGEIYARRGLHGEALERFRTARESNPGDRSAALGELRGARGARPRRRGRHVSPNSCWRRSRGDVEVLMAVARVRLAMGDATRALTAVQLAQTLAPGRSDLLHLQARVAVRLDDRAAAIEACRRALELDDSLVQVWYELGRLEEGRDGWTAAQAAYARALDILPTYPRGGTGTGRPAAPPDAASPGAGRAGGAAHHRPLRLEALRAAGHGALRAGPRRRGAGRLRRALRFDPEHPAALFHRATRWRGSVASRTRCRRGTGCPSSSRPDRSRRRREAARARPAISSTSSPRNAG